MVAGPNPPHLVGRVEQRETSALVRVPSGAPGKPGMSTIRSRGSETAGRAAAGSRPDAAGSWCRTARCRSPGRTSGSRPPARRVRSDQQDVSARRAPSAVGPLLLVPGELRGGVAVRRDVSRSASRRPAQPTPTAPSTTMAAPIAVQAQPAPPPTYPDRDPVGVAPSPGPLRASGGSACGGRSRARSPLMGVRDGVRGVWSAGGWSTGEWRTGVWAVRGGWSAGCVGYRATPYRRVVRLRGCGGAVVCGALTNHGPGAGAGGWALMGRMGDGAGSPGSLGSPELGSSEVPKPESSEVLSSEARRSGRLRIPEGEGPGR